MPTTPPTVALVSPQSIFGARHPGDCCECCASIVETSCPKSMLAWEPEGEILIRFRIHGAVYLTDRHVAVRQDRVSFPLPPGSPSPFEGTGPRLDPTCWPLPVTPPPTSTGGYYRPSAAARLLALGWTIHDDGATTTTPTGNTRPHHIYDGDSHVGWIAPAQRGATIDHIQTARRLATEQVIAHPLNPRYLHLQDSRLDRVALIAEVLRWAAIATAPTDPPTQDDAKDSDQ